MSSARPPNRSDLALFFAVAFGGAWGIPAVAWLAGARLHGWTTVAIGVPCMFCPALGAWLAERRRGARIVTSLDVRLKPNGWWLAGWVGPVVIAIAAFGVALTFSGVTFSPEFSGALDRVSSQLSPEKLAQAKARLASIPMPLMIALQLAQALIAGLSINAIAAFGEELGWRGYLQLRGGDDLTVGVTGLAGLIALAAMNVLLWGVLRFGLRRTLEADMTSA